MVAIICAEFAATGSVSTRSFHAFPAGKIGHAGALGSRSACADPPPSRRTTAPTTTARVMRPAAGR